jgi:hypothetical protein
MMSDESVEQQLAQIQQYLDARQSAHQGRIAAQTHGDRFSEAVYDALDEASVIIDSIQVKPFLTPSHLPVIGGLWQKVRAEAHDLVVFYVNRLAGLQAVFNREIVTTLSGLIRDLEPGGRADIGDEVAALREEIAALRAEVQRLQKSRPD